MENNKTLGLNRNLTKNKVLINTNVSTKRYNIDASIYKTSNGSNKIYAILDINNDRVYVQINESEIGSFKTFFHEDVCYNICIKNNIIVSEYLEVKHTLDVETTLSLRYHGYKLNTNRYKNITRYCYEYIN